MNNSGLRPGQRVRISNPVRGAVLGIVAAIVAPEGLPDLPGHPAEIARAVLTEWDVKRCALISYQYGARTVVFAAMQIAGQWFDLKRQHLTIRPL